MISGVMSRRPLGGDYWNKAVVPFAVLLLHAGIILAMVNTSETRPVSRTPTPAAAPIVMDLAPLPASARAPSSVQKASVPKAEPEVVQTPLLEVLVKEISNARVRVAVQTPRPKPPRAKPLKKQPTPQREPDVAKLEVANTESLEVDNSSENKTNQNKAPQVGAASVSPVQARQSWESEVLARLQQAKRYPVYSLRAKQEDRVIVKFTIDQEGRVLSSLVINSQGYSALDKESLALIARASPLPKPPVTAMVNSRVEMEVPIEFFIGRKG